MSCRFHLRVARLVRISFAFRLLGNLLVPRGRSWLLLNITLPLVTLIELREARKGLEVRFGCTAAHRWAQLGLFDL